MQSRTTGSGCATVARIMPSTRRATMRSRMSCWRAGSSPALATMVRSPFADKRVLDAEQDRREDRIGDVGDHDADGVRALRAQARGELVGRLAQRRGRLLHAGDDLGRHQSGLPADPARHRGRALSAKGYLTIVANAGDDPARQHDILDSMVARRVDGMILATVAQPDPVGTRPASPQAFRWC